MKMKLYITITWIIYFKRPSSFIHKASSSKAFCILKLKSLTSYSKSSFWPLKIALQKFSVDNFSKPSPNPVFVERFHECSPNFYALLIFAFKNVVGVITCPLTARGADYLPPHSTRGRFFPFVFSGHDDQFQ